MTPNCPVLQQYIGHTGHIREIRLVPYSFTFDRKEREANSTILSGADGMAILWDVRSSAKLNQYSVGSDICAVEVLPGSSFLVGTKDTKVRLFSFGGGTAAKTFSGHTNYVNCLKYLLDGTFLSGSDDDKIIRWNIETGVKMMTYTGHTHNVNALEVLGDGIFISGAGDYKVKRWSVTSSSAMETYTVGGEVYAVAVIDDTNFLAAGDDKIISQFKVGTLTPVFKYNQVHIRNIEALLLVNSAIISNGSDGCSYRWELGRKDPVTTYYLGGDIYTAAYIGDGTFVNGGTDRLIKRFSINGNNNYVAFVSFPLSRLYFSFFFHILLFNI